MKKFIIIFLIGILKLSAQNDNTFGVKSGINLSQFTPDLESDFGGFTIVDYQNRIGFSLGIFYEISLTKKINLQPELLFSNQGTRIVTEIEAPCCGDIIIPGEEESKFNENIVSLPIILEFLVIKGLIIELGSTLSYTIGTSNRVLRNSLLDSEDFEVGLFELDDITSTTPNLNEIEAFDFSASLGIGYNLSKSFSLKFRYTISIIERNQDLRNSVFNLGGELKI